MVYQQRQAHQTDYYMVHKVLCPTKGDRKKANQETGERRQGTQEHSVMKRKVNAEAGWGRSSPDWGAAKNTLHLIHLLCTTQKSKLSQKLLSPLLSYLVEPSKVNSVSNWIWGVNTWTHPRSFSPRLKESENGEKPFQPFLEDKTHYLVIASPYQNKNKINISNTHANCLTQEFW